MLSQKKLVVMLMLVLLALVFTSTAALAQDDVACENDVVVQADDWLSKLADKFFGDILAYPALVSMMRTVSPTPHSFFSS